jgi:hypothetical protein
MTVDIEKLKALALAARDERVWPFNELAFQRAANSAAVLELIAEVERLRTDRETAVKEAWHANAKLSALKSAAPAAGTVEKDAERLDWLERTNQTFCGNYSNAGFRAIGSSIWHGTLREAIDGAMQKDAAIEAHNARSPSCGS